MTEEQFSPGPGVNVICGSNAQGKTNLLEGLWLFTGGRSFRGAKDSELVAFGEPRASVRLLRFWKKSLSLFWVCLTKVLLFAETAITEPQQ